MNHYKQIVVHGCSFLTIPFEEENINRKGVNFDLIKQSLPKEYHHLNINRKFIESRAPDIYKKMVHYHDILHEYVFSTRLGKKLGCDVQNLSKPGANNQQMIRRLYEWINEMDKEDKTLIISSTNLDRLESLREKLQSFGGVFGAGLVGGRCAIGRRLWMMRECVVVSIDIKTLYN